MEGAQPPSQTTPSAPLVPGSSCLWHSTLAPPPRLLILNAPVHTEESTTTFFPKTQAYELGGCSACKAIIFWVNTNFSDKSQQPQMKKSIY